METNDQICGKPMQFWDKFNGVWSFVLFNDTWSQKGHSASNTTVILASSYLLRPLYYNYILSSHLLSHLMDT